MQHHYVMSFLWNLWASPELPRTFKCLVANCRVSWEALGEWNLWLCSEPSLPFRLLKGANAKWVEGAILPSADPCVPDLHDEVLGEFHHLAQHLVHSRPSLHSGVYIG